MGVNMNLIILALTITACTAAQLPLKTYLPETPTQLASSTQSQNSQSSMSLTTGTFSQGSGNHVNRRPQQEVEKNAAILKLNQDANESGFYYSYETSNGIKAEEVGNTAGTQGGFSYQGDDGKTYTITFTANKGGFQPQGAHLPVAPPTPEAILLALQMNANDEAAGIFDDGKYNPKKHGGGLSSQVFISSSTSQGSLSSTNHQGSFNSNTGYSY